MYIYCCCLKVKFYLRDSLKDNLDLFLFLFLRRNNERVLLVEHYWSIVLHGIPS